MSSIKLLKLPSSSAGTGLGKNFEIPANMHAGDWATIPDARLRYGSIFEVEFPSEPLCPI
jgi:hypothetical protein